MNITPALQKVFDKRIAHNLGRKCHTADNGSCQIFTYELGEKCCAVGYVGRRTKQAFNYSYPSEEKRNDHIKSFFELNADYGISSPRNTEARELNVGDVLVSSWGYDQTNIDYYLVQKLIGKTQVEIVKIGRLQVYSSSAMTGRCVPDVTKIVGEPFKKKATGKTVKIESFAHAVLKEKSVIHGSVIYEPDSYTTYA